MADKMLMAGWAVELPLGGDDVVGGGVEGEGEAPELGDMSVKTL